MKELKETTVYSDKLCKYGHNFDVDGVQKAIRYRITGVCHDCQLFWSKKSRDKRAEARKDDQDFQENKRAYNREHARKRRREKLEEVQEYQRLYHAKRRAVIQEERAKRKEAERVQKILKAFDQV